MARDLHGMFAAKIYNAEQGKKTTTKKQSCATICYSCTLISKTAQDKWKWKDNTIKLTNGMEMLEPRMTFSQHSSHGLVVMTPASHAGGRQFKPGWLYCFSRYCSLSD
eukprot:4233611-Amphidinium_carterae.3